MKGTDVGFLLLIRFILDFLCAFKPKPIWEVLYGLLFCIVGFVLLADEKPGSDGINGLFIVGGAGWSLYWLHRMCKPKVQQATTETSNITKAE